MTTQTQAQSEHYQKYETLFNQKTHVVDYIPFTQEQVRQALDNGDTHLNTLPLGKWDMAASFVGWTSQRDGVKYKSLSEQVCLLKHAAKYHYL